MRTDKSLRLVKPTPPLGCRNLISNPNDGTTKREAMRTRSANYYGIDIIESIIESIRFMEPVKVIKYGTTGRVVLKIF